MTQLRTERPILRKAALADAPSYASGLDESGVVPHPYMLVMAVDWLGKTKLGSLPRAREMRSGQALQGVTASRDWLFSVSVAPVDFSGVFQFNAASPAIQHKLGFTQTGHSTLPCLARGAEVEHIDTQLTRSVWKARRK